MTSNKLSRLSFTAEGDQNLIIRLQLDNNFDFEVNQVCANFAKHLERQQLPGILAVVPALITISVVYNAATIGVEAYNKLCTQIQSHWEAFNPAQLSNPCTVKIPVCYDLEFALDLEHLEQISGLSQTELIQQHQNSILHVLALGFAPGLAFMGMLPEAFNLHRRATPRTHVPAGSVAIANQQCVIYPSVTPGGWHIIGRCPLPLFTPDKPPYVLYQPGDIVRFKAINRQEFMELTND